MIFNALLGALIHIFALFGFGASAPSIPQPQPIVQAPSPSIGSSPTVSASGNSAALSSSASLSGSASSQTSAAPSAQAVSLPAGSAWLTVLPLGDGKYSTSGPKKGYVYVCNVAQGGGGAQEDGPWINESAKTWTPANKIYVQGSVSWPSASYSMTISGSSRILKSNDLPTDHPTGTFPIQASDPAAVYDRNPNTIKAQSLSYTLPAYPSESSSPNCIYGMVGIMNDGVLLFDGFDAEYRDAVAHEIQDSWGGHPEVTGQYHDHGFEDSVKNDSVSTVLGFAFDGYPITGAKLPDGNYLHTADLDECHGITSTVELDGKEVTTYHYVLTQDFPYSVGCFRGLSHEPHPGGGSAAQAGATQGPSQSGQSTQQGQTPPQAAIDACSLKASGAACSFTGARGTISGVCKVPPQQTSAACIPE